MSFDRTNFVKVNPFWIKKMADYDQAGAMVGAAKATGWVTIAEIEDALAKTGGPAPTPPIIQKIADIIPSKRMLTAAEQLRAENIARAAARITSGDGIKSSFHMGYEVR